MNIYFLIASILSFILVLGHSLLGEWVGERVLVSRIVKLTIFEQENKDILSKRILRLAWHVPSVAWCGIATVLLYLASIEIDKSMVIIARIISITFFVSFVFSLIITRGKHSSWILFILISVLTWIGGN